MITSYNQELDSLLLLILEDSKFNNCLQVLLSSCTEDKTV